jgi:hypothetical protein
MAKPAVALIIWLCLALPAIAAQPSKTASKPIRPAWSELAPAQQQVLAPLAPEWNELDAAQRKKWVSIANRYPKMKTAEQERLQQRMKEWAALTPAQRQEARETYLGLKKLNPSQRRDMAKQWDAYRKSLAQPETQFDPPVGDPITPAPGPAAAVERQ